MITVTGATGQLGRLVVAGLLDAVPASEVTAVVRDPGKAADLAERGVTVRVADYDNPDAVGDAVAGTDRLLLISGNEIGKRVPQHEAVVTAAAKAGVSLIAYTSVLQADRSPLGVAPEHKATEEIIRASGLPYVLLRNGWYSENYVAAAKQAIEAGALTGSAGEGRVASATRADYAAGAVAVLTGDGHAGRSYELSGDVAWSFPELAAEISRIAGKEVPYRSLTSEQHRAELVEAGRPEAVADFLVAMDAGIAEGWLGSTTGDLSSLTGRPTTPIADTLAAGLGADASAG